MTAATIDLDTRTHLSIREVMDLTGVCRDTVNNLIRRKELVSVKVLGRRLILVSSFREVFGGE